MGYFYETARRIKDSVPGLPWLYSRARSIASRTYWSRFAYEARNFNDVADTNVLPEIFHYWSNTHLRPIYEEYGFSNPEQFFAKYLHQSAQACAEDCPVFASIGAGSCDTEVRVAKLLRESG